MRNTIIASIVAVICTAAICVTAFVITKDSSGTATIVKNTTNTTNTANTANSQVEYPDYMTEEQAMAYIGVNETVFGLLKNNLKSFEGAYMEYTYTNDSGKEETITVFKKDKLDEAVEKYMSKAGAYNFKTIQEMEAK